MLTASARSSKATSKVAHSQLVIFNPFEPPAAAQYSGPASDRNLERLTLRRYTRHRSQLVDRWLVYADSEGFSTGGRQGMGGASHV